LNNCFPLATTVIFSLQVGWRGGSLGHLPQRHVIPLNHHCFALATSFPLATTAVVSLQVGW
jgi:hypothetical protein